MKVCKNCNRGYPDNTNVCPRCGNRNLIYYQGNPGSAAARPSNFKFGEFFKEYFRMPHDAKFHAGARGDYGSALILCGIMLFAYFLYFVCLQGGISIRYYSFFSAAITLLFPILFFITIAGFQYLNVLFYGLYSRSKMRSNKPIALPIFCYLSGCKLMPAMIMALASLFSLASPILGCVILAIAIQLDWVYGSFRAKLTYGIKPKTFLDSFVFVVTGIGCYAAALGINLLVIYIYVNASVHSAFSSLF